MKGTGFRIFLGASHRRLCGGKRVDNRPESGKKEVTELSTKKEE